MAKLYFQNDNINTINNIADIMTGHAIALRANSAQIRQLRKDIVELKVKYDHEEEQNHDVAEIQAEIDENTAEILKIQAESQAWSVLRRTTLFDKDNGLIIGILPNDINKTFEECSTKGTWNKWDDAMQKSLAGMGMYYDTAQTGLFGKFCRRVSRSVSMQDGGLKDTALGNFKKSKVSANKFKESVFRGILKECRGRCPGLVLHTEEDYKVETVYTYETDDDGNMTATVKEWAFVENTEE